LVACTLLVAFGGVGLIVLIIVLFPDGHLPTQRWAVWAYAGLVACVAVVGAATPMPLPRLPTTTSASTLLAT
jgi:hypothetical protein